MVFHAFICVQRRPPVPPVAVLELSLSHIVRSAEGAHCDDAETHEALRSACARMMRAGRRRLRLPRTRRTLALLFSLLWEA